VLCDKYEITAVYVQTDENNILGLQRMAGKAAVMAVSDPRVEGASIILIGAPVHTAHPADNSSTRPQSIWAQGRHTSRL